jgi:hypothetical protein
MPYREKIAWLSSAAILLAYIPYFGLTLASASAASMPDLRQLGLFAITTFVQLSILGAGHLYLRRGAPEEARMPPDERDRAIIYQSMSYGYYCLIAGMIVVGGVMPFFTEGWKIVNAAFFMIVGSELVHNSVVIYRYRKQA